MTDELINIDQSIETIKIVFNETRQEIVENITQPKISLNSSNPNINLISSTNQIKVLDNQPTIEIPVNNIKIVLAAQQGIAGANSGAALSNQIVQEAHGFSVGQALYLDNNILVHEKCLQQILLLLYFQNFYNHHKLF